MVNIIIPDPRNTYSYNSDTGQEQLPNSIEQMAQNVGIMDTMHQLNQEGQSQDEQLREQYEQGQAPLEGYPPPDLMESLEEPEQEERQAPRKKKHKGDKRFDDLTRRLAMKQEETEYYAAEYERAQQERDAEAQYRITLEKELLALQHKNLGNDKARLTDIIAEAAANGDARTQAEANELLHRAIVDEVETERAIHNYDQQLDILNNPSYPQPDDAIADIVYEKFVDLSDVNEIQSPAYEDWLANNPYYNPYDIHNFDEELASDVRGIKREFNKWLKMNRQGTMIGTDEYYQELDAIINQRFNGSEAAQQEYYQEEGYEPMVERRVHVPTSYGHNYAPVTPVSRQGYSNYGGGQSQYLPPLNQQETQMVRSMPMWDEMGRPITDERSKEIKYKQDKLAMMNGGL